MRNPGGTVGVPAPPQSGRTGRSVTAGRLLTMRETATRYRPIAAGLLFLFALGACASGASSGPLGGEAQRGDAPVPASSAAPSGAPEGEETAAFRDDALIVRTGTLELQVGDVDAAAAS